jgi:hypothetical protein
VQHNIPVLHSIPRLIEMNVSGAGLEGVALGCPRPEYLVLQNTAVLRGRRA